MSKKRNKGSVSISIDSVVRSVRELPEVRGVTYGLPWDALGKKPIKVRPFCPGRGSVQTGCEVLIKKGDKYKVLRVIGNNCSGQTLQNAVYAHLQRTYL